MVRWLSYVALVLSVCASQGVGAEAPSAVPRRHARVLSLREAFALALGQEQIARRSLQSPSDDPMASGSEQVRLYGSRPVRALVQSAPGCEGLLVAGEIDRPILEVQRDVNHLLLNVETAYWNLAEAHRALRCPERGLGLADEVCQVAHKRYLAGTATLADCLQCRGQYERFRKQRRDSLEAPFIPMADSGGVGEEHGGREGRRTEVSAFPR